MWTPHQVNKMSQGKGRSRVKVKLKRMRGRQGKKSNPKTMGEWNNCRRKGKIILSNTQTTEFSPQCQSNIVEGLLHSELHEG